MGLIKVDYGSVGEATLNPTVINAGYLGISGASASVSQPIDLNKTYIVSICANMNASRDYMDTFSVVKGEVTLMHDTPEITQYVTVDKANSLLQFTNGSTTYYRTYCITQID